MTVGPVANLIPVPDAVSDEQAAAVTALRGYLSVQPEQMIGRYLLGLEPDQTFL